MVLRRALALGCAGLLAWPAAAYASVGTFDVGDTVSTVTGIASMLLAAVMLVVVWRLRRVADGSAIADNISYVMGASMCLAASVLLGWIDRFVASAGAVRAGADILVMVAMLLFAVYFARVGEPLRAFLARASEQNARVVAQDRRAVDAGDDLG